MGAMKRGQSLFEAILALALFALLATTLVSLSTSSSVGIVGGGDHGIASALAREGIDAARSVRDRAWNEIIFPSNRVVASGGVWQLSSNATGEAIGKFSRILTFEDIDIHSKKVTALVSWQNSLGISNAVSYASYLTNWKSQRWIDTDWSNPSSYTSHDGNINTSGGSLALRQNSDEWIEDPSFSWNTVVGGARRNLNGVDGASAQDVWVVGDRGNILRFDGTTWARISHSLGNSSIRAIDVVSPTNIWTVGETGKIYRYNGSTWVEHVDTGSHNWNAISMVSPTLGFAVGNAGWVAQYNGSTWNVYRPLVGHTGHFFDIQMISATDGWISGASGKILRWNGTVWAEHRDTGGQDWETIFVSYSPVSSGWVLGLGGNIWRWDGSAWSSFLSPVSHALRAVQFFNQSEGWAVGNVGTILQWEGTAWQSVVSPTPNHLNELFLVGEHDGWAVGNDGTILRLEGGSEFEPTGHLISRAFDMVDASPVEVIEWDENLGCASCRVKFQVQVSNDALTWFPNTWMGPDGNDGDESDFFDTAAGKIIPVVANGYRWMRYKVVLEGDTLATPTLSEVRIDYQ